jgi:hypothetical protein
MIREFGRTVDFAGKGAARDTVTKMLIELHEAKNSTYTLDAWQRRHLPASCFDSNGRFDPERALPVAFERVMAVGRENLGNGDLIGLIYDKLMDAVKYTRLPQGDTDYGWLPADERIPPMTTSRTPWSESGK